MDSIKRLIVDADLRKTMGAAAKQQAKNFDITILGKQLCDIINNSIHAKTD
jgi:hypothetical protein